MRHAPPPPQTHYTHAHPPVHALARVQANDMVLACGHTLEWYVSSYPSYAIHCSRRDGCDACCAYLKQRVTRGVVRGSAESS